MRVRAVIDGAALHNEGLSVQIPLLAKEGWPRHHKIVPFRKVADGVVAHKARFGMRCKHHVCERPHFIDWNERLAMIERMRLSHAQELKRIDLDERTGPRGLYDLFRTRVSE